MNTAIKYSILFTPFCQRIYTSLVYSLYYYYDNCAVLGDATKVKWCDAVEITYFPSERACSKLR